MADGSNSSLARSFLLAHKWALLVLVIPILAWLFGHAAQGTYESKFHEGAMSSVIRMQDSRARAASSHFLNTHTLRDICTSTDPRLDEMRGKLSSACSDMRQLHAIEQTGQLSLLVVVGTFLALLGLIGLSTLNRPLLYVSFRLATYLAKLSGLVLIVLQGVLLVWMSFWVTAVYFNIYAIKLILIAGAFALFGVGTMLKALFSKPYRSMNVDALVLPEQRAPDLWAFVKKLSQQVGAQPPEHIIVGIDDNFFVAEGPMGAGLTPVRGRVLYISLSLLRRLSRDEAKAVLAHELAHFSGNDTVFSKRLNPYLIQYDHYLQHLNQGAMSRLLLHYMALFRNLFQIVISKERRQRELRADRVSAELSAPEHMRAALAKISAYSLYRGNIEQQLFEQEQDLHDLSIFQRVSDGFTRFVTSSDLCVRLLEKGTPHPFDSHPPLRARLENLGLDLPEETVKDLLLAQPGETLVDSIEDVEAIEQKLWKSYEHQFAEVHKGSLAYRLDPKDDAHRARIEEHFPPVKFMSRAGKGLRVDVFGIHFKGWPRKLPWDKVEKLSVVNEKLIVEEVSGAKRKIHLLFADNNVVVGTVGQYYNRHLTMRAWQKRPRLDGGSDARLSEEERAGDGDVPRDGDSAGVRGGDESGEGEARKESVVETNSED